MTTGDLALLLTLFVGFLAFAGWLVETVGPCPFEGERRPDWQ